MNDLKTIRKINALVESDKQRKLAVAMNNPSGHPKDAEKGRSTCKRCNGAGRVLKASGPPFPVVAVKCPDCT